MTTNTTPEPELPEAVGEPDVEPIIVAGRPYMRSNCACGPPPAACSEWACEHGQRFVQVRVRFNAGPVDSPLIWRKAVPPIVSPRKVTPEQREAAAREAYPYEHVGYSRPVPEGCSCDECFVTDMERIAYAAGLEAASDVEQIARAIDATAAATHHPDSPEGPQS